MEDKLIEIARFDQISEAEVLASLLKSEGIECCVHDEKIGNTFFGPNFAGVRVELLKKDTQRALGIMKDYNYEIPEEFSGLIPEDDGAHNSNDGKNNTDDKEFEEIQNEEAGYEDDGNTNTEYMQNRARLSRNMTIIIILMIILFGALVVLNKYFQG